MDAHQYFQQLLHFIDRLLHPSFIISAAQLEQIKKAYLWQFLQTHHSELIEDIRREAYQQGKEHVISTITDVLMTPLKDDTWRIQQLHQRILSMDDFEVLHAPVQSAVYEPPVKQTGPIVPAPKKSYVPGELTRRWKPSQQAARMEVPAMPKPQPLHPYHLKPASPIKGEIEGWEEFQHDQFLLDRREPWKKA